MAAPRYSLTFIIIFILSGQLNAEDGVKDDCKHDDNTFRCVKYIKNYDADTITFLISGLHPLFGGGEKGIPIRVNGVDTPELRTKNKCEKKKGYEAKLVVEKILKKAKRIDLKNVSRGKYFRIVADVYVDGVSIKDLLLTNKLAYAYDGGTKSKIDWCNVVRMPSSD